MIIDSFIQEAHQKLPITFSVLRFECVGFIEVNQVRYRLHKGWEYRERV